MTRPADPRTAARLGAFAIIGRTRAATPFKPSDSLVEAAQKEGKFILYTATFTEVEQEVINEFRKKFPFIQIEMLRAPGGQLIQRVKTEAAAGKLAADVLVHSDRGLTKGIENIFRRLRATERRGLSSRVAGIAQAVAERSPPAGASPTTPRSPRIRRRPGWISPSRNTPTDKSRR